MRILAIDPGTKDFGVALYEDGAVDLHQCRMPGASAEVRRKRTARCALWKILPAHPHLDALIVEKQFLQHGKSAQFSLAMSAGVLSAVLAGLSNVEEWREVAASSWNHRGRGLAAATRCAERLGCDIAGADDAKSALGLLLHYLVEVEATPTSMTLAVHPNLWKELHP